MKDSSWLCTATSECRGQLTVGRPDDAGAHTAPADDNSTSIDRAILEIDLLHWRPLTHSTTTMAFLILVIGDLHIPDRALDIPPKVNPPVQPEIKRKEQRERKRMMEEGRKHARALSFVTHS